MKKYYISFTIETSNTNVSHIDTIHVDIAKVDEKPLECTRRFKSAAYSTREYNGIMSFETVDQAYEHAETTAKAVIASFDIF